jgi:hypothetical protein
MIVPTRPCQERIGPRLLGERSRANKQTSRLSDQLARSADRQLGDRQPPGLSFSEMPGMCWSLPQTSAKPPEILRRSNTA